MTARPRVGDVIAVPTPKGTGYVQYFDRIRPYGALIRILPGLYDSPPPDLQALADQHELYWVFVPLGAAVHRGVFTIAGHATIPPFADHIPVMRNPAAPQAWDAKVWYLWDGVSESRVGPDDPRIPTASPKATWNDIMLIERIADGWRPEDEMRPPAKMELAEQ
jgi:hypothetical protein